MCTHASTMLQHIHHFASITFVLHHLASHLYSHCIILNLSLFSLSFLFPSFQSFFLFSSGKLCVSRSHVPCPGRPGHPLRQGTTTFRVLGSPNWPPDTWHNNCWKATGGSLWSTSGEVMSVAMEHLWRIHENPLPLLGANYDQ